MPPPRRNSQAGKAEWPELKEDAFEIVFAADSKVDDGRYANNGWLQELPDPISKLTWDNAALISPAAAKKLGVISPAALKKLGEASNFDGHMNVQMIVVSVGDRSLTIPALVAPGAAENSITIPLGYGRTVVGRVGRGDGGAGTGFNAYPLRTSQNPYFVVATKVTAGEDTYPVGVTQEHGTLEGRGADLTREATFEQYKAVAEAPEDSEERQYFQKTLGDEFPPNVSLYSHPPLDNIHQWGMTIDLNTCTGCSACMVACQAENNIPIVGKEQVIGNREMHWMRTDRYWASREWRHGRSRDGLAADAVPALRKCAVRNRLPGQCHRPQRGRHQRHGLQPLHRHAVLREQLSVQGPPLQFLRLQPARRPRPRKGHGLHRSLRVESDGEKGHARDTIKMQKNPNVTVRMRGVMEKCTFCVQRVQEAKIAAKVHARDSEGVPRIPTDVFTSACAQVCPTNAIVFGDINNPESEVSKIKARERRSYRLLEYLNLNTRVHYLARIRNPNPKMPDAAKLGSFLLNPDEEKKSDADSQNGGSV